MQKAPDTQRNILWFIMGCLLVEVLLVLFVPLCATTQLFVLNGLTKGMIQQFAPSAFLPPAGPLRTQYEPVSLFASHDVLYVNANVNDYVLQLSDGSRLQKLASPVLAADDGIFYTQSYANAHIMEARRVRDGQVIWKQPLGVFNAANLKAVNGVLYSNVAGSFLALRASDGKQLWHYTAPSQEEAITTQHILLANDVVYMLGAFDLYAFRANDGTLLWHYPTNANVLRTLLLDTDTAYIVTDTTLSAIRLSTGTIRWSEPLISPIIAGQEPGKLYFLGGGLITLQTATGAFSQSKYAATMQVNGVATLLDGIVYYATTGGYSALRASDGMLLWSHPTTNPLTLLGGSNGVVYWQARNALFAVQGTAGQQLWSYSIPFVYQTHGVLVGNSIYYAYTVLTTNAPPYGSYANSRYYSCTSILHAFSLNAQNGHVQWQQALQEDGCAGNT